MKVAIGCDPNANALKKLIITTMKEMDIEVKDFGSDDPIYANVVIEVCEAVVNQKFDRGIVLCGTGIGASMTANKVKGAYCALATDMYQAQRAVLSNNANILALGAQVTGPVIAQKIVETFLSLTFDPESRSKEKVDRIIAYEKGVAND